MGGAGGSPPERKIEDGMLIECPFPPLFSSLSPGGEEGGDPPLLGLGSVDGVWSGVCERVVGGC